MKALTLHEKFIAQFIALATRPAFPVQADRVAVSEPRAGYYSTSLLEACRDK